MSENKKNITEKFKFKIIVHTNLFPRIVILFLSNDEFIVVP